MRTQEPGDETHPCAPTRIKAQAHAQAVNTAPTPDQGEGNAQCALSMLHSSLIIHEMRGNISAGEVPVHPGSDICKKKKNKKT